MIWAVDRYMDRLKEVKEREPASPLPRYEYFDTEEAAKQSIIDRAAAEYVKADTARNTAYASMCRVKRKFSLL